MEQNPYSPSNANLENPAESKTSRRCSPGLAAVISYFVPVLGHIYAGSIKRGIYIYSAELLLILIFAISRTITHVNGYYFVIIVAAGFIIYLMVDAARCAKKRETLTSYNKWYFYVVYAILFTSVSWLVQKNISYILGIDTFRIPSSSMEPTIVIGDFLISDTWAYHNNDPQRGDIMVFSFPDDPSTKYIKRVIGLPGDKITYANKELIINGEKITTMKKGQYTLHYKDDIVVELMSEELVGIKHDYVIDSNRPTTNHDYEIPENEYFVMGDNRDNSNDSRYRGPVPLQNIYGKATYTWFSWSTRESGVAWKRVGLKLE